MKYSLQLLLGTSASAPSALQGALRLLQLSALQALRYADSKPHRSFCASPCYLAGEAAVQAVQAPRASPPDSRVLKRPGAI